MRGKKMQLNPADWDLVPMPNITENDVMYFLTQHKGEKYDLIGCVRSVIPFVSREHPEKWFCSEVCATLIGHAEPWRMHPGVLHMVESSGAKNG